MEQIEAGDEDAKEKLAEQKERKRQANKRQTAHRAELKERAKAGDKEAAEELEELRAGERERRHRREYYLMEQIEAGDEDAKEKLAEQKERKRQANQKWNRIRCKRYQIKKNIKKTEAKLNRDRVTLEEDERTGTGGIIYEMHKATEKKDADRMELLKRQLDSLDELEKTEAPEERERRERRQAVRDDFITLLNTEDPEEVTNLFLETTKKEEKHPLKRAIEEAEKREAEEEKNGNGRPYIIKTIKEYKEGVTTTEQFIRQFLDYDDRREKEIELSHN